jgi:hypothetical protein
LRSYVLKVRTQRGSPASDRPFVRSRVCNAAFGRIAAGKRFLDSLGCLGDRPPRHTRAAVTGTIVGVDANMLTVATGPAQTVVINDEPALSRMATGRLYTGRVITAYGYWNGGEFVATRIS